MLLHGFIKKGNCILKLKSKLTFLINLKLFMNFKFWEIKIFNIHN